MERIPVVIGNWKIALSHKGAVEAATALKKLVKNESASCDVVICPSFPSLPAVAEALKLNSKIKVGAQNVHWEEKGAWTGEVSVLQIKSFVTWCIVGHSERRQNFGETNEQIVAKMNLLIKHGITPVVCVGETAAQRDAGQAVEVVTAQVKAIFSALNLTQLRQVVLAYEPVWAIGSGALPAPDEAAEIMLLIRKVAREFFEIAGAERLRILYGGSVTAETAGQFAAEPGIDGVLVGGASVRPMQLAEIVQAVQRAHS